MTSAALLLPRLRKEVRGLLPAWLACFVAMPAAAVVGGGRFVGLGIAVYFLGAIALGALSMGHEYSCRTLGLLLSQPARRERLLLEKLGVLAAMLLALFVLAQIVLLGAAGPAGWRPAFLVPSTRDWWSVVFVLPLLLGLFVAPWLTMLCRNPLAGMVFTLGTPGAVLIVGEISGAMTLAVGSERPEADLLQFAFLWQGILAVSVIAAVSSWFMFMRLEAIDGRGHDVRLPSWLHWRAAPGVAVPAFTRRRPMWLLAKKELRLQQLTLAVSGLYLIVWFSISSFTQLLPGFQSGLLFALTVPLAGAIPLLAGSLASAEERQLGTLEWQALLPMAAWKQWAVKAGVAAGVAVALSLALPTLLFYTSSSPEIHGALSTSFTLAEIGCVVVLATVVSLYVSSLCTSGLRALLVSLPVVLGMMAFVIAGIRGVPNSVIPNLELAFSMRAQFERLSGSREGLLWMLLMALLLMMYVGTLGMLLRFALTNHRSAERGAWRVWQQIMGLVVFLAIGTALWGGAFRLYAAALHERERVQELSLGAVTGVAVDSGHNLVRDYSVVIFRVTEQGRTINYSARVNAQGGFEARWLRPGQYFFVAIEKRDQGAPRDPELLDRARAHATPITLTEGEKREITLTLSIF